MKRLFITLVILALALPVFAADLTVTVPANAVANASDMCERIRIDLRVLAANWSNDACATEFLRLGLRTYTVKEKREEIEAAANDDVSVEANLFDVNFPTVVIKSSCGDTVTDAEFGETCDDGNHTDWDGCAAGCLIQPHCGDGNIDPGSGEPGINETCDDAGESITCDIDCSVAECGDGVHNTTASEQCDDGNLTNGDGCESNCTLTP